MDKSILLEIAREAIEARFDGVSINKEQYLALYPELNQQRATFVTITTDGVLRGCIGSIIAHRSLIDDVISNAQSAAFADPRFPPLTKEEYDAIRLEVSLLTEPESVDYADAVELRTMVRPKVDGVILKKGNYQATFLPQVWDQLPHFDMFISHLGLKAGLGSDPLSLHPDIYLYQVEKIEE